MLSLVLVLMREAKIKKLFIELRFNLINSQLNSGSLLIFPLWTPACGGGT